MAAAPETRVFYLAGVVTAVAAVVVGGWRGGPAGLGVAAGGALSLVNFAGLYAGASALIRAAAGQAVTAPMRWGLAGFFLRFALLAGCVFAIIISRLLPLGPVLGGLFAVPVAALGEGLRLLCTNNSGSPTSSTPSSPSR
jgi:hypothetical protein